MSQVCEFFALRKQPDVDYHYGLRHKRDAYTVHENFWDNYTLEPNDSIGGFYVKLDDMLMNIGYAQPNLTGINVVRFTVCDVDDIRMLIRYLRNKGVTFSYKEEKSVSSQHMPYKTMGYDICSSYLESALYYMGFSVWKSELLNEDFGSKFNEYGLLSDYSDALRLRRVMDFIALGHEPYVICKIDLLDLTSTRITFCEETEHLVFSINGVEIYYKYTEGAYVPTNEVPPGDYKLVWKGSDYLRPFDNGNAAKKK